MSNRNKCSIKIRYDLFGIGIKYESISLTLIFG
jgi:hypothetical protein